MNGSGGADDAIQRANDASRNFLANLGTIAETARNEGLAIPDLFDKTTGKISTVSKAGSDLRTELKNIADSGRDSALQLALAQDDPKKAVEVLRTEMQKTRDKIAEPLKMQGVPPEQIDAILAQLDLDPAKIEMLLNPESRDKALADLGLANGQAQALVKDPAVKGLEVNSSKFDQGLRNANAGLDTFDAKTPTPKLNADRGPFDSVIAQATASGVGFGVSVFAPKVDANKSPFDGVINTVKGIGIGLNGTTYSPTISILGGALDYASNVLKTLQSMNGTTFSATLSVLGKVLGGSANGSLNDGRNWDRRFMPKFYANGGIENHMAQIAKPSSTLRVWAEPETGGEAYIPLAASKRARSTAILDEVASRFGYELVKARKFADGGVVGGPQATGSGVTLHIDAAPGVAYQYAKEVGVAAEQRFRDAQVLYDIPSV
jgi:hypothetical protein